MDSQNGKYRDKDSKFKYYGKDLANRCSMGPVAVTQSYEMFCLSSKANQEFCEEKLHIFEPRVFHPLWVTFEALDASTIQNMIENVYKHTISIHYFNYAGGRYPVNKLNPSSVYITLAKDLCPITYKNVILPNIKKQQK